MRCLGCGSLRRLSCGVTIVASSVGSNKVTSAGEADASRRPTGIPWPSATTIHFVPLPRLVFPTHAPLFCREKARVDERFVPVEPAGLVQIGRKRAPDLQP